MEGQTFRIFLTLYVGNMILVESLKAIKVAARKAQMSFKITTFTANVDSNQIFRTLNLVFLLFKLVKNWRGQMHLYLWIVYLRANR